MVTANCIGISQQLRIIFRRPDSLVLSGPDCEAKLCGLSKWISIIVLNYCILYIDNYVYPSVAYFGTRCKGVNCSKSLIIPLTFYVYTFFRNIIKSSRVYPDLTATGDHAFHLKNSGHECKQIAVSLHLSYLMLSIFINSCFL